MGLLSSALVILLGRLQARRRGARIRPFGTTPVDPSTSTNLLTALRHLDHTRNDSSLESALNALADAISIAVASCHSLELTISSHGHPVVLTTSLLPGDEIPPGATSGGPALTSLRVPLVLLDARFEPGSQLVVYATALGSLVDLAADLAGSLASPADTATASTAAAGVHTRVDAPSATPAVALDVDLPPRTQNPGVRGLSELSAINHAEGLMIDRGHHPDEVDDTLHRQAASAGLSPHTFALGMLQGLQQSKQRRACSR